MEDLLDIISLYKDHYDNWRNDTLKDIYHHIYPSLYLGQYTINRDDDGKIYGFTNWAFFNEDAEQNFLDNRSPRMEDWLSGDKTWIIDSIYTKEHNGTKFNKPSFDTTTI